MNIWGGKRGQGEGEGRMGERSGERERGEREKAGNVKTQR